MLREHERAGMALDVRDVRPAKPSVQLERPAGHERVQRNDVRGWKKLSGPDRRLQHQRPVVLLLAEPHEQLRALAARLDPSQNSSKPGHGGW